MFSIFSILDKITFHHSEWLEDPLATCQASKHTAAGTVVKLVRCGTAEEARRKHLLQNFGNSFTFGNFQCCPGFLSEQKMRIVRSTTLQDLGMKLEIELPV